MYACTCEIPGHLVDLYRHKGKGSLIGEKNVQLNSANDFQFSPPNGVRTLSEQEGGYFNYHADVFIWKN